MVLTALDARDSAWFAAFYERHVDMVFRVCRTHLRHAVDTEDATQDVFLKVLSKPPAFKSAEHEKAWLIRVAINRCKDQLKSSWNKRLDIESVPEPVSPDARPEDAFDSTIEHVMALPENLRICVYLFYYEGYNASEIAKLVERPHSTVRNYLSDARKILKEQLGGEYREQQQA